MRAITDIAMPGGLIVLGALLCVHGLAMPEAPPDFARLAPPLVFLVGMLLGARFHSGQIVLALLTLAVVDGALRLPANEALLPAELVADLRSGLVFLLPLDFILLGLPLRRGILTPATLWRLAGLVLQPVVLLAIHWQWPGAVSEVLGLRWFELGPEWSGPVTQPVWLAFAVALVLLPVQYVLVRSAVVGGLFWALVAALLALHVAPGGLPFLLYAGVAGLVLIVSQVENSYLLVFRDDLTGLPARRALDQALTRLGRRYTIAMVDIDHFKGFNDTWGHEVGDQLLRMIGTKLTRTTGGGTAFRYGGEEFTLLFPGKRPDEAMPHIQAVLEAIRSTPFTIRGSRQRGRSNAAGSSGDAAKRQKVSVTVSIGVAATRTAAEVLREADEALYRAKSRGRDRIVGAGAEEETLRQEVQPPESAPLAPHRRVMNSSKMKTRG